MIILTSVLRKNEFRKGVEGVEDERKEEEERMMNEVWRYHVIQVENEERECRSLHMIHSTCLSCISRFSFIHSFFFSSLSSLSLLILNHPFSSSSHLTIIIHLINTQNLKNEERKRECVLERVMNTEGKGLEVEREWR